MVPDPGPERRLLALIDRALELPSTEREGFLRVECGSDAGLFEAAKALLAACHEVEAADAGHPADLMQGIETALAERYRLLRPIGRGGNAVVYLAHELHHNREVALKVIYPGVSDPGRRRRFLREIAIIAGLRHPFIVPLLDSGAAGETLYYVMPYVEGESLRQRLDREGPLPQREVLAIAHDVGEALGKAHAAGIVHRDIKPQNILLSGGHALVADFGVALALEGGAVEQATPQGVVVGTPAYMSPEQAGGSNEVNGRSDVYALGCVIYEMLTGEVPYPADTPRGVIAKHLQAPIPDVAMLRPGLSDGLSAVIQRAMAKVPADRFSTVGELVEALTREAGRTDPVRPAKKSARNALVGGAILLAVGGAGAALLLARSPGSPVVPMLAVGTIRQVAARDSAELSPMADLLATSLSQLPSMQVLSSARLIEIEQSLTRDGTKPGAAEVARRARATELLEGTVYRRGGDSLVLELRQTDLKTGRLLHGYRVAAGDVFTLVDRATAEIARAADVARPARGIAEVTTGSLVALRMYQEGLRSYYGSDMLAARRLFQSAVDEDSTFAMAMWYLGRVKSAMGLPDADDFLAALRLASRASDRERLLITADILRRDSRTASVAVAESLVARYPSDPDGYWTLGVAVAAASDYTRGLEALRRAIALDSSLEVRPGTWCRVCDAYANLTGTYLWMDSILAAVNVAEEFVHRDPESPAAWGNLSNILWEADDSVGATNAESQFFRLFPGARRSGISPATLSQIKRGEYDQATQTLLGLARSNDQVRTDARWYGLIALRNQGRLRDALRIARGNLPPGDPWWGFDPEPDRVNASIIELEQGKPDSCITQMKAEPEQPHIKQRGLLWPGQAARETAWAFGRLAMCQASVGDTSDFAMIADTLRQLGFISNYGRDRRLHHYVRGLLWKARGKPEQAVAEFQAAISSPNFGFTRINYELGQLLLQLGRPGDAVAILQPALRGALDASNLYLSRTEIHELLAKAWDSAGQADSARVHWAEVERAWRGADPQFRARWEVAKNRVRRDTR